MIFDSVVNMLLFSEANQVSKTYFDLLLHFQTCFDNHSPILAYETL